MSRLEPQVCSAQRSRACGNWGRICKEGRFLVRDQANRTNYLLESELDLSRWSELSCMGQLTVFESCKRSSCSWRGVAQVDGSQIASIRLSESRNWCWARCLGRCPYVDPRQILDYSQWEPCNDCSQSRCLSLQKSSLQACHYSYPQRRSIVVAGRFVPTRSWFQASLPCSSPMWIRFLQLLEDRRINLHKQPW